MSNYLRQLESDVKTLHSAVHFGAAERLADDLEKRAQEVRDAAQQRLNGLIGYIAASDEVEPQNYYGADLSRALMLHIGPQFGRLSQEWLKEYPRDEAGHMRAFIDAMDPIADSELPVPVVINSTHREGGYRDVHAWREYHFALVDPDNPFYAQQTVKRDATVHAFTGAKDTLIRKSFGLRGLSYAITAAREDRTIGARLFRKPAVSARCELLMNERALKYQNSMPSDYIYSGLDHDVISGDFQGAEYTVGWEGVEGLVMAEPAGKRRITAAKNVANLLFPDYLEMSVLMPRVARIIDATKALKEATGELDNAAQDE